MGHPTRLLALGTVTLLASAGLAAVAPTASAAGLDGGHGLSWSLDADTTDCTVTGDGNDGVSASVSSTGAASTLAVDKTMTAVRNGEPADTAKIRVTGRATMRATEAAGAFRSLTYAVQLTATSSAAYGLATACEPEGSIGIEGGGSATVTQPGWLVVSSSSTGGGALYGVVSGNGDGAMWTSDGSATSSSRVWVTPGTYSVGVGAYAEVDGDPTTRSRGAITGSLAVTYVAAGAATTAQAGTGSPYVGLAAARTCGSGSVAATFTAAGAKVATAVFAVNGMKRAVLKNPRAGQAVAITGIPTTSDATVTAVLTLDAKKPKKGKKPTKGKVVTVTRGYAACG